MPNTCGIRWGDLEAVLVQPDRHGMTPNRGHQSVSGGELYRCSSATLFLATPVPIHPRPSSPVGPALQATGAHATHASRIPPNPAGRAPGGPRHAARWGGIGLGPQERTGGQARHPPRGTQPGTGEASSRSPSTGSCPHTLVEGRPARLALLQRASPKIDGLAAGGPIRPLGTSSVPWTVAPPCKLAPAAW